MNSSSKSIGFALFNFAVFAIALFASATVCMEYLDSVEAKVASQNRAAWTQVYWVRRGQLRAEAAQAENWKAFQAEYSPDYCRLLLQSGDAEKFKASIEFWQLYWKDRVSGQASSAKASNP
jgi:hypothetical protein